jgi:hypothetical protein
MRSAIELLVAVVTVLRPYAEAVWAFLNTNFSAALFGALAGALSAHSISTRAETRKRLREEIAGVNSAIALANTISNAFVSMKRQNVRGMAALYKRSFDEFIAVQITPPVVPTEIAVIFDIRTLTMPLTSISELRKTLLERVPTAGAAISISVVLHQCISSLADILVARENVLALLHAMNVEDRTLAYFGLRTADGHIDERYPDLLNATISFVDDGIYFPILLCEVLVTHGERLRKAYGKGAPEVKPIIYKAVTEAGLMPDFANYPDFEKAYRSPKVPTITRWQRVSSFIDGLFSR